MSNVRTGARRDTLALYGPTPTSGVNPGQQDSHGLGEMGMRKGDSREAGRIILSISESFLRLSLGSFEPNYILVLRLTIAGTPSIFQQAIACEINQHIFHVWLA